ncbi:alpha/beta-hydrolase [Aureobasidium pullulans]|uniref:Carboxylic ester hydrolase n=1 Tax=Aureobasidium pullulans TaxID=5580 RepID=A0A4S9TNP8_AURPU|nr:alpha/beta-hydrolase [Aureobasidium pullulans]
MMFVTIQYRLGGYGFLSPDAIEEESAPDAGLLDVRAATEWVQRNIRTFGGDPSKITIRGGSAGGGAVANQLTMYGGQPSPPSRAAIAESPWMQSCKKKTVLNAQYSDILSASNCSTLTCLRSLSEEALTNAIDASYEIGYAQGLYAYGYFYYGPAVDGRIIQDLPSQELEAGNLAKVPLITDHTTFERAGFSNFSTRTLH